MDIKSKYIEGWRVFLRWIWFSFILAIAQFPVRLIINNLIENEILPAKPYTASLGMLIAIVLLCPFVLYYVSEWTGEFIAPRRKRSSNK